MTRVISDLRDTNQVVRGTFPAYLDVTQTWLAAQTFPAGLLGAVSPVFAGVPQAPTAAAGTSTTQLATTAFVGTATNFLQAGTGAVTRTQQNKSRDTFSVKDFGAVGDGVTDDSVAIQAALNAIAATSSGNGSLYLPGGYNFLAVGLTWSSSGRLKIYGDGPSSFMTIANTTGTLFTGSSGYIEVEGLTVQHGTQGASSAGYFFSFSGCHAYLRNIQFFNGYNAARWIDGCNQSGAFDVTSYGLKNDLFQVDVSAAVPPAAQSGNIMFDRINAQAITNNTGCGLRATSCDGLWFSNSLIGGFQNGTIARPSGSRSYLANLFFSNIVVDGAGGPVAAGPGYSFDGTSNPMLRVFMSNCWAGSMPGGAGASVKKTKNFNWIGGTSIDNGTYGILLDDGANEVLLEGLVVTGNSSASVGTYDGILAFTGADKVRIKNCRSGASYNGTDAVTQTNRQQYGINISDAGTTFYELIGNDVSSNLTGGINDNGGTGGRRIVRDNLGYNPIGMSAITLGASPATYTNGATPATVWIAGGTISSVTVAGTQVATAVPAVVPLNPNQAMVVTYTVAPTITVVNKQ